MYCGACGRENPSEDNYCSGCGKPLRAATLAPQQTPEPPDKKYSVVLTAAPQYDLDRFVAIRQLAAMRQISEKESTLLVENAPSIVASVETFTAAETLQHELQPLGLTLVIRPYGKEELTTIGGNGKKDTASKVIHAQSPPLGTRSWEPDPAEGASGKEAALSFATLTVGAFLGFRWLWQFSAVAGFFFTVVFFILAGATVVLRVNASGKEPSGLRITLGILRFAVAAPLWTVAFGILGKCLWMILTPKDLGDFITTLLATFPWNLLAIALLVGGVILCGAFKSFRAAFGRNITCPICKTVIYIGIREVSFECQGCKQRVLVKDGVGVRL